MEGAAPPHWRRLESCSVPVASLETRLRSRLLLFADLQA